MLNQQVVRSRECLGRRLKMKEQLIREITNLESQLEHVDYDRHSQVDFSLLQSYKEMIHARREMLQHLPKD